MHDFHVARFRCESVPRFPRHCVSTPSPVCQQSVCPTLRPARLAVTLDRESHSLGSVYQVEDDKSEFLARAGYTLQNWQLLKRDILEAVQGAEYLKFGVKQKLRRSKPARLSRRSFSCLHSSIAPVSDARSPLLIPHHPCHRCLIASHFVGIPRVAAICRCCL